MVMSRDTGKTNGKIGPWSEPVVMADMECGRCEASFCVLPDQVDAIRYCPFCGVRLASEGS